MASGENRWLKLGERRHRDPQLAPHPRQRAQRQQGDRRPGAPRAPRSCTRASRDVHATGHAKQEELKTLLSIAKPQWFMPVHGEYRHLVAHARLARPMGVPDDARPAVRGRRPGRARPTGASTSRGRVPAGYLYVDGIVGDVGHGVLRDRRVLAEEGVVVVIVTVDVADRHDDHRPRDHHPGLGLRARGRGAARRGADRRAPAPSRTRFVDGDPRHSSRCSATVRRAAGRFVNERTAASR